jgi:hypothetical protein
MFVSLAICGSSFWKRSLKLLLSDAREKICFYQNFFAFFFPSCFSFLQIMSQLSRFLFVAWTVQLASGLVWLTFFWDFFFLVKKKLAKLGLALAKAPTVLPYLPPASPGQEEERPSFQTMETESHSTVADGLLLEMVPIRSPHPPTMASHGQDSEQAFFPYSAMASPTARESGSRLGAEPILSHLPQTESLGPVEESARFRWVDSTQRLVPLRTCGLPLEKDQPIPWPIRPTESLGPEWAEPFLVFAETALHLVKTSGLLLVSPVRVSSTETLSPCQQTAEIGLGSAAALSTFSDRLSHSAALKMCGWLLAAANFPLPGRLTGSRGHLLVQPAAFCCSPMALTTLRLVPFKDDGSQSDPAPAPLPPRQMAPVGLAKDLAPFPTMAGVSACRMFSSRRVLERKEQHQPRRLDRRERRCCRFHWSSWPCVSWFKEESKIMPNFHCFILPRQHIWILQQFQSFFLVGAQSPCFGADKLVPLLPILGLTFNSAIISNPTNTAGHESNVQRFRRKTTSRRTHVVTVTALRRVLKVVPLWNGRWFSLLKFILQQQYQLINRTRSSATDQVNGQRVLQHAKQQPLLHRQENLGVISQEIQFISRKANCWCPRAKSSFPLLVGNH